MDNINPWEMWRKGRNDRVGGPLGDRWWADIGSIRNFIVILRDRSARGVPVPALWLNVIRPTREIAPRLRNGRHSYGRYIFREIIYLEYLEEWR